MAVFRSTPLLLLVVLEVLLILPQQGQAATSIPESTTVTTTTTTTTPSPSPATTAHEPEESEYEYAPYDGWYNNMANPSYGGAETQLFRRVPPAYSDGSYEPSGNTRPNPMDVSMNIFNGSTGNPSTMNKTAFLVFFGQQVVEEILDAQRAGCPPEYFNLKIPKGHVHFEADKPKAEMPLLRSRYDQRTGFSPNNPRQQLNEISSYMDGGLVYGANKAWADVLRTFRNGTLKEYGKKGPYGGAFPEINDVRLPMANPPPPRDHILKPISRFFMLGNPRGNENPFLLTMGIMWFRYHNYRARELQKTHPDWNDEQLFNEARKWVIGIYQNVVMYDWLPTWLTGNPNATVMENYSAYDPSINPGIAHIFQSAAMRFGHTLVTPGVFRRNASCVFRRTTKETVFEDKRAVRTCNSFWNPQESVEEADIDEFIMGMASQIAEREDNTITPDLRGDVFGPLEFSRRDLMAVNIQRGRDHGLPDYNTARVAMGLKRKDSFEDIVSGHIKGLDPTIAARLSDLYKGDIDNLDIWPAGMLETNKSGPGELFFTVIVDQFRRIRDGDRFWFENRANGLFTEKEIAEIKAIRVIDVIKAVTTINLNSSTDIQENPFLYKTGDPCPQEVQLNHENPDHLANCTARKGFDYFEGSEWSYALSFFFLLLTFPMILGVLMLLARKHGEAVEKEKARSRVASRRQNRNTDVDYTTASEWQSHKEGTRNVRVKLDARKKVITLMDERGRPLRTIDIGTMARSSTSTPVTIMLSADKLTALLLRLPKEYDLVLNFDDVHERHTFVDALREFLGTCEVPTSSPVSKSEKMIYKEAVTKDQRKKQLEMFFKAIFAHVTSEEEGWAKLGLSKAEVQELVHSELTKFEFADSLGLRSNSSFVESMFKLIDEDNNGYISFREFLDLIVVFYKGSADDKVKLLFNMYDFNRTGTLSREEFKHMLKSLVELGNDEVEESRIDDLIESMFSKAGLSNKDVLTLEDFQMLLRDYESQIKYTSIDFNLDGMKVPKVTPKRENIPSRVRKTLIRTYSHDPEQHPQNRMSMRFDETLPTVKRDFPSTKFGQKWMEVVRYVETYKLQIFWLMLYTLVSFGIFIERAYYYSVEREHAGLRQIAGYGVTVTRGAASGMMFTFSCLLVTMCRNLITFLRETFLHRYVPFDSAINFHKYIAFLALFFTVCHIIGHAINFYHISTQTANDLSCLFRNFFHATDELPKFHYWCWNTLTGFTGVLLTVNFFLIYVFGIQYARRHTYKGFWFTHNTYIIFFILMFLHGAGRLVQPGFLHYFFLGPGILFALDRLVSMSRKKVEISVVRAELLPSDVTYLEFKKPNTFQYKSGQWLRIACVVQGKNEYHPFTISSAPHEENLGLHIRAVGPWTYNLRRTYDPAVVKEHAWPKVLLDGPYGEGHQEWYRYEVAVLVGGGIGVTPFASILKDIAHMSKIGAKINCKKIYFLWVTRTQKQFEWLTDIIREVEQKDEKNLVSVHIFVTQFRQKFDIRTTMLYICETHFQKFSGRSLFTGLQSITHFGRPNFESFFKQLTAVHPDTNVFGVFSCGPPPMTRGVEQACADVNKYTTNVLFSHHFENF